MRPWPGGGGRALRLAHFRESEALAERAVTSDDSLPAWPRPARGATGSWGDRASARRGDCPGIVRFASVSECDADLREFLRVHAPVSLGKSAQDIQESPLTGTTA